MSKTAKGEIAFQFARVLYNTSAPSASAPSASAPSASATSASAPSASATSAPLSTPATPRPARSALLDLAPAGLSTAVTPGPETPTNAIVHIDKGKGKAITRTLRTRRAITYNLFADTGDDDDGGQVAGPSTITTKRARPVIPDSEDDEEYDGKTPILQAPKRRQRTGVKAVPTPPSETTSGEDNLAYRLRILPHTLFWIITDDGADGELWLTLPIP
ncbi:hypothetical protein HBI26_251610, partial [Parastagonospora nodorum]